MVKGTVDIEELKRFQKNLEKIKDSDMFLRGCTQELAARLMRKVIKNTPVGQYPPGSGKVGGTLRRGWKNGPVEHEGSSYRIDIINPVEYASYVEYGHRTANHRGWVKGQFMMTKPEKELQPVVTKILQARVEKYLKGALK